METLSADKDSHKAGDIVYHIPEHTAERVLDLLGMTGLSETQRVCQGQSLKRADTVEECLYHILRQGVDLADTGPENLLQLVQANMPAQPGPGLAIGFPVQALAAANGVPEFARAYRVVFRAQHPPNVEPQWDPYVLSITAMAISIAAQMAFAAGQNVYEVWVAKKDLLANLKEEDLLCPKDILCISDVCLGQEEGKEIATTTPICTNVS
jgi:hypothetical protein